MRREGLAFGGTLAGKSALRRYLRHGPFRRELILGDVGFEFFERECQLVNQKRRAFRSLAVNLALRLGDPKLLLVTSALSSDAFAWPQTGYRREKLQLKMVQFGGPQITNSARIESEGA